MVVNSAAGNGPVWVKPAAAYAVYHTQGSQGVHRLGVPRLGGHVGEGYGKFHILVQKQGVEHLGHLRPCHAPVGAKGAVRVAGQIGHVVL